ncbi:hypothetical protein H8959_018536 [Pygathrix nigripes]
MADGAPSPTWSPSVRPNRPRGGLRPFGEGRGRDAGVWGLGGRSRSFQFSGLYFYWLRPNRRPFMRALNYSSVQTTESGRSWGWADTACSFANSVPASILARLPWGLWASAPCKPSGFLGE